MNFKHFPQHSLKTRVTLTTLGIFLISIWLLAFYLSRMLRDDMQRILGEQQISTVTFMAAEVNRGLDDRLKALEKVAAKLPPVLLEQPFELQLFMEEQVLLHSLFNGGIIAYQADGDALAEVPLATGRIGSNHMYIDTIAVALREGRSNIGWPILGKALQAPVFGMTVPIRDARGAVVGALAGVTNLGQANFLDQITASAYGKTGSYTLLTRRQRLVLTSSDKTRIMQPQQDNSLHAQDGSGIFINAAGVEVLASSRAVPLADWSVETSLATQEAFAPIHAMQRRMLLATLVLTLLAGGLTWWMLRRQLAPLLAAINGLAGMAASRPGAQTLPITRPDEIGELIAGFNHLLETLGHRETLLKQIFDNSSVAIFLVDRQGRITQANQRMASMFRCSLEALEGSDYLALIHPSERAIGRENFRMLMSREIASLDLDRLYWRADRSEFWGHLTWNQFSGPGGENFGQVGVISDISERKHAEAKLELAASVFTHAREGIMITAADGRIIDINDTFSRITGYSRSEVVGQNPRILSSGRQQKEFYAALWRSLTEQGCWYGEVWNRRKNGEVYAEMQTISAVRNADGKIAHYVSLFSDITVIKEHEKRLEHIAHYDALTSLPNRVLLADRLHQAMAQAQRNSKQLAVAYLDLDGFKAINDQHGHHAGDQLLIALARHMKQALREGDTFARLGGDEFVVVLVDLADVSASVPMLSRLLAAAAQPVPFNDLGVQRSLQVSASLGVTFYPQTEEVDADHLLRQADQAMYQAKLAGRNRYHVFDAEQDRNVRGHHESLERIRAALAAEEFVLHYQPKVNLRSGAVIGAEALIRWQHPEQGLLAPALFLPSIEEHPLAIELGEWVIATALRQILKWRDTGLELSVSVNIGAHQLQQKDFVLRLQAILDAHPSVRPEQLELEVLETSALEDLDWASQVITAGRELGVKFALDDFGTGYSSLTYLKRLPVTQLKIDQSFVRGMLDDPDDLAILEGVIGMASAFRREVIAEGVESLEHGEMLLQLGCELAQGYGIARPMPAENMPAWVKNWRPDPAWVNAPPVSRDDFPLLFANVEHRAWTAAIASYLKAERDTAPPLEHDQCRLGIWLEGIGLARYATQPAFHQIDSLHRQAHTLAGQLLALHAGPHKRELLSRLGELDELHLAMHRQMNLLLQSA